MKTHFASVHRGIRSGRGRGAKVAKSGLWTDVLCQRLFVSGPGSSYFEIRSSGQSSPPLPEHQERLPPLSQTYRFPDPLVDEVDRLLDEADHEQEQTARIVPGKAGKTEVSPWLELTQWPRHLSGLHFPQIWRMVQPPQPQETNLQQLCESFDRIVWAGKESIEQHKINDFDQSRINSFIRQRRLADRPIMVKLQKGTWVRYSGIWKRLLCFVSRTTQPEQAVTYPVALTYNLSVDQLSNLDAVYELLRVNPQDQNGRWIWELDRRTLLLCISLLDHTLKGDLFDSVVVGFFAAMAVDPDRQVFMDAIQYTPLLSGFIKIAQVLVIQRAVLEVESGDEDDPADLLDIMRERFLIHGSRSPFSWALRLRAYGKQVRNTTTSLGHIRWLEDKETIVYKQTRFSLQGLRDLIVSEMRQAQQGLEQILFVEPGSDRNTEVPYIAVGRLSDDPSKTDRGWSFLKDPLNKEELASGSGRWLLDRILCDDKLRDRFIQLQPNNSTRWLPKASSAYLARVDQFLSRLLLLIHLTSGQPARGTELLSLRYQNTVLGHIRGVFIDNGMVSTVTAYHKGYSITGSTKIIHRYLPKEVGELLVYYLWLVRPLVEQLQVWL